MHKCATNPSVVGPNAGFESLSESFPKFEFKIFLNLTFPGYSSCSSDSRNVWLLGYSEVILILCHLIHKYTNYKCIGPNYI